MTHKGSFVHSGDDDEIHAQEELRKKVTDLYWKLLERHSDGKKTAAQWYAKSKDEGQHWLSSEQMVEWGVIDGIIQPERRELAPLSKRRLRRLLLDLESEEE